MEITDAVRTSDLLGGLSPQSLARLSEDQRVRTLDKGSLLFTEGTRATSIYVLASGSVRLLRVGAEGREVVLHMVRPGELFAEAVLFETDTYPVTAEAREACSVIEITTARVHELLADEAFRRDFLAAVMRKVRFLGRQVYVLSSCDVHERLLRFLEERYARRSTYDIELTKKEVAAAIATTPETLSRLLSRMEADGALSWEGSRIRVSEDAWDGLTEDDVGDRFEPPDTDPDDPE